MESVWPTDAQSLIAAQEDVAAMTTEPWRPSGSPEVGGCWVCFTRGLTGPGAAGDPAWSAAVVLRDGRVVESRVEQGSTASSYRPGLLALRMGPVMEAAVRGLRRRPDVLLLDATARDHPRGAGLALHLGQVLDLPTVGVTHRPLVGRGDWPGDERGAARPVRIGDQVVGCWLRTRPGTRPLVVHPGWQVDLETAIAVVLESAVRRTPEPLRQARRLAREARG
ncbi:MAG TPA: endonuclease V [Marmoricola sp.]|nr:endonuclease V [Marmoricola sp.]